MFGRAGQRRAVPWLLVCVALGACPKSQQVDPKKSQNRVELAKDFLRRNEREAAATEARKALTFDPRNPEAENILGLVAHLSALANHRLLEVEGCLTGVDAEALRDEYDKSLQDAAAHFRRAKELDPDYGEAWANLGVLETLMGEPGRAITSLETALGQPSSLLNVGLTRANLGWAHFLMGDHARAAKALRQALQFQPQMCLGSYRLARVYFARQEWEKAQRELESVVSRRECPIQEAYFYLTQVYAHMGQPTKKAETQAACVKLAPESCIAARCRSVGLSIDEPSK